MSFDLERQNIEQRLLDNFTACPIQFENIDLNTQGLTNWVALEIEHGRGQKISLAPPGQGLFRQTGVIQISVFQKPGTGSKMVKSLADQIAGIFRDAEFDGIHCREPYLHRVGDADGWYQIMVLVPYYRDEVI